MYFSDGIVKYCFMKSHCIFNAISLWFVLKMCLVGTEASFMHKIAVRRTDNSSIGPIHWHIVKNLRSPEENMLLINQSYSLYSAFQYSAVAQNMTHTHSQITRIVNWAPIELITLKNRTFYFWRLHLKIYKMIVILFRRQWIKIVSCTHIRQYWSI